MPRLRDRLQRRTVCQHADGQFPTQTKQFWYEQASATIWWDLDLLCQSERDFCKRVGVKKHVWLKEFNSRVATDIVSPEVDGAAAPESVFQEWALVGRTVVPRGTPTIYLGNK